ncbi:NAC domain-containing protein 90 [Bienertia sinuspersici]
MSGDRCRGEAEQQEWFFFIPKQEREVRGGRPNRLTTTGYWKATGSPGYVYSSNDNKIIGVKRTMVFYRGRARTRSGSKTEWKMNEYMAIHHHQPSSSSSIHPIAPSQKGDYTVCRVYKKSKCLRAFDRRPGAPIINRRPLIPHAHAHAHHQVDQPSSSDHQPHQNQAQSTVQIIRFSSSESSSSSGDHHQLNNTDTTTNIYEQKEKFLNMEIDEQGPLWEWDSFMNWDI